MHLSSNGLLLIQSWEGIRDGNPATINLEPYIDPVGVYTVGWGHALYTPAGQLIDVDVFGAEKSAKLSAIAMDHLYGKQGITKEEASQLLGQDAEKTSRKVTAIIGESNATQSQFDAMVSLAFNIGLGAYEESTVRRLHMAGNRIIGDLSLSALAQSSKNKESPTGMALAFARWSNAGGHWMLGLYRRRVSELMIYGGHDYSKAINTAKGYGR